MRHMAAGATHHAVVADTSCIIDQLSSRYRLFKAKVGVTQEAVTLRQCSHALLVFLIKIHRFMDVYIRILRNLTKPDQELTAASRLYLGGKNGNEKNIIVNKRRC